jgi:hypothetical protein
MRPSPKRPVTRFWNGSQDAERHRMVVSVRKFVRKFLGVRYFRPLESKSSVKNSVPSVDVNGP